MSSTGMLAPGGEFADLDADVSGTIFDSCPAYMSAKAGASVGRCMLTTLAFSA